MPHQRKGAKFEQISEFERGRIVDLREAGLSYRAVAARVQRNSSTIMRVSKQWTEEGRTARTSGSGLRNVTSWRADWPQVVFSDESRFNLWHHDGRIRVRHYAGERHIPECIIERHSGRTPRVKVCGAIAYHGRSQLLRIVGNLNSTRYINEVLQPQAIPFLQGLPGAVFQQGNARPYVAKTVKSYLNSQQIQLLFWPAYSPDMSPIEHVWDIVGQRLARELCPVASTEELWLRIQTIWEYSCAGRYSKKF
ncbi:transposable element Tcb2 transposase [Trichonephila clavipes]|nr:transposable element Tcb2 transposase [Trichonephila clavipes]